MQVRRIVLVLLALVLVPSMATASWYRCTLDGTTRSVCCCPARQAPAKKAPAPEASLRAACCCTVTHITSRASAAEVHPPVSVAPPPAVLLPVAVVPPQPSLRGVPVDRPCAQGDPPDTLLARRCSLLL